MSLPDSSFPWFSALGAGGLNGALVEYWIDAWQRSVLYCDILRQRGDTYLEHAASGHPPVLVFDYDIIVDGRELEQPVNYALSAIRPPDGCPKPDPAKRPFVVIDPRAGHGPGIGGFKMDSEIGIALRQGHPCYFVMFFPVPEPKQTIECVWRAEKIFLQKVNQLHPHSAGKPFVIGNCQGGWALAMLAATAPELVGPILLAGSPLSYWAGVAGKNPMRYSGGLYGGTWMASLVGDLGHGQFDGAHLVSNFEQLDPANTYWKKPYSLYAKVDTERERFLEFERWWGGHYLLNKAEMEWITQNLFVGNRLSHGEVTLEEGRQAVDLRNIRSPIVVFASWGDNITPPQQALFWIADLYHSVEDIRVNEQTIVYCLHEQVGHLGIFVSAGVANKEHSELASALDLIDVLPPGLYEAIITDTHPEMVGLEYLQGRYVIRFEPRDIDDILALGDGRQGEAAFEVVRRVGEVNQQLYDTFISPWLRLYGNEHTARWWREMHPSRLERRWFSSRNPWLAGLRQWAEKVRDERRPAAEDNPFWRWQQSYAQLMETALDGWRDGRDAWQELSFRTLFESPWSAALTGLKPQREYGVRKADGSWERSEMLRLKRQELEAHYAEGGPVDGFLRLLIYVAIGNGVVDVRPFNAIRRVMQETALGEDLTLEQFKQAVRRQTWLVRNDEKRALATLEHLLPTEQQRQFALELAILLLQAAGPISGEKQQRLGRLALAMGLAQRHSSPPEAPAPVKPAPKRAPRQRKPKPAA
ncbi:TerB family tellurite resistance protein [Chromobacterium haemolyticum]|uniref:TerB family tellurite resistance protein n=1 Tax=Chromobacterium haemolyticum TaxID=394935 RepID=UPI0009DB66AE|nr:TerB family tellurite resistance protein [Chromobacterium haemolyticum]OQS38747.1 3-hydroxyalkanoate synthetase [Chromobacterium haemolyticum]